MTEKQIIEQIKNNNYTKALNKLYKNFPKVLAYVIKCGGKKHDAEDIFQDSLLVCIEKIKSDSFELTSSLSTYLIGIAKNKTKELFRYNSKYSMAGENELPELEEPNINVSEQEEKYKTLDKVLMEVGKKCMDILILFYHKNLSMKVISDKLGFKSETSAKTQKYKCLEKAKKLTSTLILQTQNQQL